MSYHLFTSKKNHKFGSIQGSSIAEIGMILKAWWRHCRERRNNGWFYISRAGLQSENKISLDKNILDVAYIANVNESVK